MDVRVGDVYKHAWNGRFYTVKRVSKTRITVVVWPYDVTVTYSRYKFHKLINDEIIHPNQRP